MTTKKDNNYFIMTINSNPGEPLEVKYEEVAGKAIKISGFEMEEFFIHKKPTGLWAVTDGITGTRLGRETETRKDAIASAEKILSGISIARLEEVRQVHGKDYGFSPRCSS
jgi:hypothetical protein